MLSVGSFARMRPTPRRPPMRRLLSTFALLAASGAFAPAPMKNYPSMKVPSIRFVGANKQEEDTRLYFVVSNPTDAPLRYLAYNSDLTELGIARPVCAVEISDGKQ